jgi:predicted ATPase
MLRPVARPFILTPDQRVRVFVSSTMEELAAERAAVQRAVASLHLVPVMFELGARPHPPRSLYRSYLEQSDVFLGLYWQRYGWVAPGMDVSGLEDEYVLSAGKPRLIYVKRPAPEREDRLTTLLGLIRDEGDVSYRGFETAAELERLVADDLAVLLSETFQSNRRSPAQDEPRQERPLPAPPTPFVGREDELARLRELVRRERLVTLTGPGGIGKTRLAVELASQVTPDLADGAALVALGSLQDPALVAGTVAHALGVREEGPEGPLAALKDHLADRRMLLVLDNFEHVMAARTVVTELLEGCRELRLVVTSREALRVLAEHEFPVASLQPEDGVALFAQRAGAVRHGFGVDDANAPTLTKIVDALEGVPLAIELAAARVRLLPPDAILERLDRRLDFLAGGAADLPERQRALRRTMDWSHDLLDADDQLLFASLGIFAGSFSLAAAEAVCGTDGEGDRDVLDGLASLVDKSLLRAEPSTLEPRFRMLTMVRDYALEKLETSGRLEDLGRRHAEHYRQHTAMLRQALRGPEQAGWVDHLGRGSGTGDIDNIRAAMRWYLDRGRLEDLSWVIWSMWLLGWISGRLEECRQWALDALAAEGSLSDAGRARLLTVAGLFEMWKGEHEPSVSALTEAVGIARELEDDDILANSLMGLSLASSFVAGVEVARAHAEEALRLFRASGDRWGQGVSFSALTWFLVAADDLDATGDVFEQALSVAEQLADELNLAMIEANVAEYHLHHRDADTAAALLAAALRRYRRLRAFYPSTYAIDGAARLATATGRYETAAVLLGAADAVRDTLGVPVEAAHQARRNRVVEQVRSALGDDAFGRALAEGRTLRYEDAVDAAIDAVTAVPA